MILGLFRLIQHLCHLGAYRNTRLDEKRHARVLPKVKRCNASKKLPCQNTCFLTLARVPTPIQYSPNRILAAGILAYPVQNLQHKVNALSR